MKSLISLGMAVFVLGFFFSTDLVAEGKWGKKLITEGWVNVTKENWADTTWYGHAKDKWNEQFDFIRYIHPDGRNMIQMNKTIGSKSSAKKWEWKPEKNGKICIVKFMRDGTPYARVCGKTIWKKDNSYIVVSLIGRVVSQWRIKKGNLEKF